MGKKPETPPIDLSAKKVTIPKAPEVAAPAAQTIPVDIRPGEIKLVKITPAESNGAKAGTRPSEEDVRVGAYFRWDAAGRPGGDGVRFWLEAEQDLISGGAGIAEESLQKQ